MGEIYHIFIKAVSSQQKKMPPSLSYKDADIKYPVKRMRISGKILEQSTLSI